MEVNHKMINSSINGVARHDSFEDEEEEEDFIQKVGMGRSYDCVFCRRGFTTAQALGGHMNVHRRDRATKNHNPTNAKPSSSSSSTSYSSVKPSNLHSHASRAYNLSPPSRRSAVFFDVMSLGPQSGGDGGGGEVRRASQGGGEKGKEDLDLELRLGYYPYW